MFRGFMVKIDRKLEHALIILNHLSKSKSDKLYTAKELSVLYDIAFDSASRVMQRMASNGFLTSVQGPVGGYRVTSDLNEKNLLELLKAISKKSVKIAKCIGGSCDKRSICNIVDPVESLNDKLTEFYSSIELDELLCLKV